MRSHCHKNLKNLCYSQTIVKPLKRFCNRGFYEINQQKQKDGQ